MTQWEHPAGTTPSVDHLIQISLESGVHFEWLATGRGVARASADPPPALLIEDYALDQHESQALERLRRMTPGKRRIALEILDLLGR